jgi:HK97 family phage prohead protease
MSNQTMEIREASDGEWKFQGYASVVGRPYAMPGYTEVIVPGAFRRSLAEQNLDVRLLLEHDGPPIARTPRTMTLSEDAVGLKVEASLDSFDPLVRALKGRVDRGDIREMSFAFTVYPDGQRWNEDFTHRELTSINLQNGDTSIVGAGANKYTTLSISERASETTLEQRRLRAETIGREVRAVCPLIGHGEDKRNAQLAREADARLAAATAKMDKFRATSPLNDADDNFARLKRGVEVKLADAKGKDAERVANETFERRLADERVALEQEARSLGMRELGGSPLADVTRAAAVTCATCGGRGVVDAPCPDCADDDLETAAEGVNQEPDGQPFYRPNAATDGTP